MKFGHKMVIGLIIGVVLGVVINVMLGGLLPTAPEWMKLVYFQQNTTANYGNALLMICNTLGEMFLRLLGMIVVPLIFVSITLSVAGLGNLKRLRKIGGYTILYYFVTTALAVLVGMILVNLIRPGVNAHVNMGGLPPMAATGQAPSVLETIVRIIPLNIVDALAKTDILQIVFFSIVLGVAMGMLKTRYNRWMNLLNEANEIVRLVVMWILNLIPFGVCFLLARAIGRSGMALFAPLARYIATVLTGLGIHMFIVLPILLLVFGKMNPLKAFRGLSDTIATAFSTASSSATLPVNIKDCTENLKAPRHIVNFVLPLGATVNMDGTALYEAVAAIFIAQAYGVNLTMGQQFIIFITATLAAVGAAGIPQAGLFTMVVVLKSVGLPLEGVGLILAVDNILDMCRTTVNTLGDAFGTVIVARLAGEAGQDTLGDTDMEVNVDIMGSAGKVD